MAALAALCTAGGLLGLGLCAALLPLLCPSRCGWMQVGECYSLTTL